MTEEEDKAIKDCDIIFICLDDAMSEDSANDYRKSYKILKNLIEKQSKMIDEILKSWKQDDVRSIAELKKYFEEIVS